MKDLLQKSRKKKSSRGNALSFLFVLLIIFLANSTEELISYCCRAVTRGLRRNSYMIIRFFGNGEPTLEFAKMKDVLSGEVKDIRFTKKLKNHPVCLTSEGQISVEMEKVINAMPTDETVKAEKVLEINESHPIVEKLKDLYENDKEGLEKYTKILYAQARLIEGLPVENPTEISNLVCEMLSK